jgi:hypothetical protein
MPTSRANPSLSTASSVHFVVRSLEGSRPPHDDIVLKVTSYLGSDFAESVLHSCAAVLRPRRIALIASQNAPRRDFADRRLAKMQSLNPIHPERIVSLYGRVNTF